MFKKLAVFGFVAILGSTTNIVPIVEEAEARRMGGGRSLGMQRSTTPPRQATPPAASPQQGAANNVAQRPGAAAQPAAQTGWRRFAAPLAGLAAGLGIAALLSHLGIGAEFAGILLALLIAVVAFAVLRRVFGNKQRQPAYAGGIQNSGFSQADAHASRHQFEATRAVAAASTAPAAASSIPADFDVEGFVHQAKVNFVRLQAANDAGNLEDIRDFSSPEMFAEIKLEMDARRGQTQRTDVVMLDAEVLEIAQEPTRYIASVRFHGLLREEQGADPQAFDEVWHLTKPADGSRGWTLSGIQQIS